eukprot:TRINITY_DN123_c8_g2_i10.p1 TRINITY_DN123_c8_g2~~TRINITY_DN123_c8_g2_i10.p1  ORF type:complete len:101 (-),score=2.33 TRINITY_DN123_c8_g2_i10:199-501(-)
MRHFLLFSPHPLLYYYFTKNATRPQFTQQNSSKAHHPLKKTFFSKSRNFTSCRITVLPNQRYQNDLKRPRSRTWPHEPTASIDDKKNMAVFFLFTFNSCD